MNVLILQNQSLPNITGEFSKTADPSGSGVFYSGGSV